MSHRIRCYTLFDITHTGILNRSKAPEDADQSWILKRNTQCNFDTILQVISLRSQPEITKYPVVKDFDPNIFGSSHQVKQFWTFDFEVQHASVFQKDGNELAGLYMDCEGVPMIRTTNNDNIPPLLDTSKEMKNIHFEII